MELAENDFFCSFYGRFESFLRNSGVFLLDLLNFHFFHQKGTLKDYLNLHVEKEQIGEKTEGYFLTALRERKADFDRFFQI